MDIVHCAESAFLLFQLLKYCTHVLINHPKNIYTGFFFRFVRNIIDKNQNKQILIRKIIPPFRLFLDPMWHKPQPQNPPQDQVAASAIEMLSGYFT